MDELLGVARQAVQLALESGATEAEATAAVSQRFATEARDTTISKLEQSTGRSLGVRVFIDGAKSSLATSDLSADGLRAMVREAVGTARFVERDSLGGLPDDFGKPGPVESLEIYFDDVLAREAEEKIAEVRTLEELIRAYDPRIDNSSGSRVSDAVASIAFANSRGFEGSYRSSSAVRMTNPVARDGDDKRNAAYGSAARTYADLESTLEVATEAARRAIGMCGARKPPTTRLPVIFERDVAAAVLGDIFTALNAANVAVGNSFLIGRVGERIGSEAVTLIDDGRIPRALGTAPFDAEGVATRRTIVFERGTLRTYLYDTYYGRKLGAASTGNAAHGGIGPSNFYLEAGEKSLEELIASTRRGVFVLDTIGFSSESVSGAYSRGARGMMIEDGELAYPIDEFTISGKLPDMLAAIDAVANDLRFDGSITSPSFRIAEMTISGN